jgi:hypothetical protein
MAAAAAAAVAAAVAAMPELAEAPLVARPSDSS